MVRMVLEQLAWAHEAHGANDDDLRKLNPTRCVTPFKAVFAEAGRFYGELSEDAHLDPAIVEHYLQFHNEGQPVVRHSMPDSQHVGYYLTALASVYLRVVQNLFSTFGEADYVALDGRLRERHREYCALLNAQAAEM